MSPVTFSLKHLSDAELPSSSLTVQNSTTDIKQPSPTSQGRQCWHDRGVTGLLIVFCDGSKGSSLISFCGVSKVSLRISSWVAAKDVIFPPPAEVCQFCVATAGLYVKNSLIRQHQRRDPFKKKTQTILIKEKQGDTTWSETLQGTTINSTRNDANIFPVNLLDFQNMKLKGLLKALRCHTGKQSQQQLLSPDFPQQTSHGGWPCPFNFYLT